MIQALDYDRLRTLGRRDQRRSQQCLYPLLPRLAAEGLLPGGPPTRQR